MSDDKNPWVRFDEIGDYQRSITDKRLRAFIDYGITTVLTGRAAAGSEPGVPFDLLLFAQVLESMYLRREVLTSIVSGDPDAFRWWPEDGDSRPLRI